MKKKKKSPTPSSHVFCDCSLLLPMCQHNHAISLFTSPGIKGPIHRWGEGGGGGHHYVIIHSAARPVSAYLSRFGSVEMTNVNLLTSVPYEALSVSFFFFFFNPPPPPYHYHHHHHTPSRGPCTPASSASPYSQSPFASLPPE